MFCGQALLNSDLDLGVDSVNGVFGIHLRHMNMGELLTQESLMKLTYLDHLVLFPVVVDNGHRSFGECAC